MPSCRHRAPRGPQGVPALAVTDRNHWLFERRHRWRRHKLFKLCAKLLQRKSAVDTSDWKSECPAALVAAQHAKFAIRSIRVHRTTIEHHSPLLSICLASEPNRVWKQTKKAKQRWEPWLQPGERPGLARRLLEYCSQRR